jgi:hypothetical protein
MVETAAMATTAAIGAISHLPPWSLAFMSVVPLRNIHLYDL